MTWLRRWSVPMLMLVLVAGCAAPVRFEYNSAPYRSWRTFAWKAPKMSTVRNPVLDSGILSSRVERAVRRVLTAAGYREVSEPAQADFLVTYHTTLQTLEQGGPSVGFAYGTFGPGYNTLFITQQGNAVVREGSLILDVIDARNDTLVWRGWITRSLQQSDYSQQAVEHAVQRIFAKFPPPEKS